MIRSRLALALLAFAAPAAAELPPQVYARARDAAASVVVVDVAAVDRPRGAFAEAACTLRGRIAAVERGSLHQRGQSVAVPLPCIGTRHRAMPGPFPGYPADTLLKLRRARLFLDGDGALVLRGLDPLPRR
ncbi:hypothetical protein [Sphingosinicella sp. BN140058]|uniref:hypothetical protein n=1 Tax=Sphingosinicella sp. BN140058 TaxID=1892855 RepID=UPI0010135726|nr:hypothetical protein [Sphingosinicella sp. BN140058]QAY77570.1 hypothetical protein ETR14_14425 [Sphingosinicella sp. BN140058]